MCICVSAIAVSVYDTRGGLSLPTTVYRGTSRVYVINSDYKIESASWAHVYLSTYNRSLCDRDLRAVSVIRTVYFVDRTRFWPKKDKQNTYFSISLSGEYNHRRVYVPLCLTVCVCICVCALVWYWSKQQQKIEQVTTVRSLLMWQKWQTDPAKWNNNLVWMIA